MGSSNFSDGDPAAGFILLILAGTIYFGPTILASMRGHNQTAAIFWLNLLLGWTGLGWIGAFIWSLTNPFSVQVQPVAMQAYQPLVPAVPEKICPRCAETVKAAAVVCRFCGHDFGAALAQAVRPTTSPPPVDDSQPRRGNYGKNKVVDGGSYKLVLYNVYGDGQVVSNDENGVPHTWRSVAGFKAWVDGWSRLQG